MYACSLDASFSIISQSRPNEFIEKQCTCLVLTHTHVRGHQNPNACIYCASTVPSYFAFTVHSLIAFTVPSFFAFTVHSLFAFTAHSLFAFTVHSLCIYCAFTEHSICIPFAFTVHSLAHLMCSGRLLHVLLSRHWCISCEVVEAALAVCEGSGVARLCMECAVGAVHVRDVCNLCVIGQGGELG